MIVSQGYDGASVMSGHCNGVQQCIRKVVPQAIYIHCQAHCLNLVLVDCVKTNPYASEFFALVQSLYVFLSSSKAHVTYLEMQNQLHPQKQTRQLQRLSDTRWACRYLALDVIASTFDSVLATLESIAECNDKAKAIEAIGLLHQVHSFKFVSCLIIFLRIMGLTKALSDQLQKRDIDLAAAADLVVSTADTLRGMRSDTTWKQMYKYITDVAKLHNIDIELPKRRRCRPNVIEGFVSLESSGQRECLDNSEVIKVNIYFPVLDVMLSEIDRRFTRVNLGLMKSLQACHPTSPNFLDPSSLNIFALMYDLNTDFLISECMLAKRTLQGKELQSVVDVIHQVLPLATAFPTLKKLLQISLTISVSTAQCERSFSALKRIKTYLRTTMVEQRLTDIALLSIERDLSCSINLEEVVTAFQRKDKNRTIVLY